MDRTALYQEQAAYCAYLLRRVLDPKRRVMLERERQDWLLLADQNRLWEEIDGSAASGALVARG